MSEVSGSVADAQPSSGSPALPSYVTDPDAVLKEAGVHWRYGRAPDYSSTRKVFAETKTMSHAAGSLPQLVENLVKNWEVEASFKPRLDEWRTVDPDKYSFAINGSDPQSAQHMLKHGTYNAIIAPNEYYSPEFSDFASSHKTFKRMMPTFAWEVLEVYSGPPTVSLRWRHWGVMKKDYVGFNNKGERVTAKAHGEAIDIQGVTVATVNDKLQLQDVRTWFDPMDMFRQIAPRGVVRKDVVDKTLSPGLALDSSERVVVELDQKVRAKDGVVHHTGATKEDEDLLLKKMTATCPFSNLSLQSKEAKAPFEPWQKMGHDPNAVGGVDHDHDSNSNSNNNSNIDENNRLVHPHLEWSEANKKRLAEARQEDAEQDPNVG